MNPDYKKKISAYNDNSVENRKFLRKIKSSKHLNLDKAFHDAHERVFQKIDCLECANCCKTTSPIFRTVDIDRLSLFLKMKSVVFIQQYLYKDEEGDYVLKTAPCPFLDDDNRCKVYESRPLACKEYPHTNRKKIHQILDLTHKNGFICPAVAEIVHQIKSRG
jgi:Fe-S-cluster containining protein